MKVSHNQAAAIVIAMYEAGVEGAEALLRYIEAQSNCAELTDRELTLRAWRRADEVTTVATEVRDSHNALVADNRTLWARLAELERRLG